MVGLKLLGPENIVRLSVIQFKTAGVASGQTADSGGAVLYR